jgi:hypothetical protein
MSNCNLKFRYITPLAAALGPGYLRFGGTRADQSIFIANASEQIHIFTGLLIQFLLAQ